MDLVEYLRAVGLSGYSSADGLDALLADVFLHGDSRSILRRTDDTMLVEYARALGGSLSLSLRILYSTKNKILTSDYLPFFVANNPRSYLSIEIDEIGDTGLVAIAEDAESGNELVFSIQNPMEYANETVTISEAKVRVAGLSIGGKIILPVERDEELEEQRQEDERTHTELLRRARAGDVAAMEDLEQQEEATSQAIRERLADEDFLTVVEGFLMPSDDEEHIATLLGDIVAVSECINEETGENLFILALSVTGSYVELCINQADLEGFPSQGMRFLGSCWLQGWIE